MMRSWPDCDATWAARFANSCGKAIVSTRTVTPACLPKSSACLRSSSSDAGTKWLPVRNVSSRFWAKAGAFPSASQDAMPALAPEATRRKCRREVPCIWTPWSSARLTEKVLRDRGTLTPSQLGWLPGFYPTRRPSSRPHCDQGRPRGSERLTQRLAEPRLAVGAERRHPKAPGQPRQVGRVRRALAENDDDDARADACR